eukprot:372575_1
MDLLRIQELQDHTNRNLSKWKEKRNILNDNMKTCLQIATNKRQDEIITKIQDLQSHSLTKINEQINRYKKTLSIYSNVRKQSSLITDTGSFNELFIHIIVKDANNQLDTVWQTCKSRVVYSISIAASGAKAHCRIITERISYTGCSIYNRKIHYTISKTAINHIILAHWFRPFSDMFFDIVGIINYHVNNLCIEEQLFSPINESDHLYDHGNSIERYEGDNESFCSAFGYQLALPGYKYCWKLEVYVRWRSMSDHDGIQSGIYLGLIENEQYMKLKTIDTTWWDICNNGCYSIMVTPFKYLKKKKYTIRLNFEENVLVINESTFAVKAKTTYRLAVGFGEQTYGQITVLSFEVTK